MSSAREEILQRIRTANANAGVTSTSSQRADSATTQRDSSSGSAGAQATSPDADGSRAAADATPAAGSPDLVDLFVERTEDYKAVVERASAADAGARVAAALEGANGVLLPAGLPEAVVGAVDASMAREDPGTPDGLDAIEAVVTTCAAAIAETGTIVLDHTAGQGRRALTLVPDLHVCLVRADQVHADVPAAVSALRASVEAGHPLTWISGPSATSDIELDRVEGVHGPRRLHVIVTTD